MRRLGLVGLLLIALAWPISAAWAVPPPLHLRHTGPGGELTAPGDDDDPSVTQPIPPDVQAPARQSSPHAVPKPETHRSTEPDAGQASIAQRILSVIARFITARP